MKFLHALAFFALLSCPLAFSGLLSPEENKQLDLFVFGHLAEGETFSVDEAPVSLDGKDYFHITISSGGEIFAVQSPSSKYGFELAADASEIKPALAELYRLQGHNTSSFSEIPKISGYISSFSKSRQPGESKCKQYIGTDMYPCYDRESCYKSCFTPLCNPLALGGGWPFIDLIVSFENSTSNLGNIAEEAALAAKELESSQTESNFKAVLGYISKLNKEATAIKTNDLFTNYQLCYPINYDLISLVQAKRLLEKIESESLPLLEIDSRSESFAKEAGKRSADFSPEKIGGRLGEGKAAQPDISNAIIAQNISEKNKSGNESGQPAAQGPESETQNPKNPGLEPKAADSQSRIPFISDLLDWIFSIFK